MRNIKYILAILLITFSIKSVIAQKKEEQIITDIKFESEKIILNNEHAFNYTKKGNDFTIEDRKGNILIYGQISPQLNGEGFSSRIHFLTIKDTIDQQFYNEKIIGRNDLIFALCENNVITNKFELDQDQLRAFIKTFNELEDPPPASGN